MKKALVVTLLLVLSAFTFGCTPRMARAAFVGAAVVGTAAIVANHAAHYHHINCGCPRHHEDGRWVYSYEGGEEYYDAQAGVWYRY